MNDNPKPQEKIPGAQPGLAPAGWLGGGWLPIQLAPKDGTRIMLWCGDEIEIGYWSISGWVQRSEGSPLGKQDGAWIIYENRSDTIELAPTHWMPLPEPPNVES
jgi:hypothetical protein